MSVIVYISKTLFGFCNNLDLYDSVFTQPNLSVPYIDNHLLLGIYFYNTQDNMTYNLELAHCDTFMELCKHII